MTTALTKASVSTPEVGDLWTLAWDGSFEGTVVITGVFPHHVLAVPVTTGAASAREVSLRHGETDLTLWPQAETGLGTFLLHVKLGTLLTGEQTIEVRRWEAQRGELTTLSTGGGASDPGLLDALLPHFQRLCFIEWPSEAEAILDVAALEMTAREFAALIGLATPRVLALWSGLPVTEDERELLGERAADWVTVAPDAATASLSEPAVKDLIVELTALTGGDERRARNEARREYALAARADSTVARNASRAADTVKALIAQAHASLD